MVSVWPIVVPHPFPTGIDLPLRSANAVDFWRGFALVSIFANHIPGFFYERFTHKNFGISDSAELFVFLAGWSARALAGQRDTLSMQNMILRVGARGVTLYAAQILITMIAIAVIAAAALVLENPLLLEWHNAAAVFQDPVTAHVGLVLLAHHLGFFDILPLYVVLMFGAVALAILNRIAPSMIVPVSLSVYLAAHIYGINIRTWPVEGEWLFNPLCWQLIFVLGFVLAGENSVAFVRRNRMPLRILGAIGAGIGLAIVVFQLWPDPLNVPKPVLLFVIDKSYLSPLRLFHALALVALFAGAFGWIAPHMPGVSSYFCLLGRNSLYVFCVGSLASLAGQLARFHFGGTLLTDTAVLIIGLTVLGLTGWLSELRSRLKGATGGVSAAR